MALQQTLGEPLPDSCSQTHVRSCPTDIAEGLAGDGAGRCLRARRQVKLLRADYEYRWSKGNALSLRLSNLSQPTHRQAETWLEYHELGEFQQEEFQRGAGADVGARQ